MDDHPSALYPEVLPGRQWESVVEGGFYGKVGPCHDQQGGRDWSSSNMGAPPNLGPQKGKCRSLSRETLAQQGSELNLG